MFYEMVHKMAHEMAFVVLVTWIALMVLEKRQIAFRWAAICSALLYGFASFLGIQLLAIVLQLTSLCLLLLGWICKVHWQIKHGQREKDS